MRAEIEQTFDMDATDYGLSEVSVPRRAGMHRKKKMACISGDHFYPEVIDPRPARCCRRRKGELVFTSLTKEAFRSSAIAPAT
jgi:phenylacetate-CoA ligase